VYNRGVDERPVFMDDPDRELFVTLLLILNDADVISPCRQMLLNTTSSVVGGVHRLVNLIAFCLMNNHYHLVLQEVVEGGISKFMQRLGTAYTMYFNEKYDRSGSLFQGRFKSRYIEDEKYLMSVVDYTHINPVSHKKNGEQSFERRASDLQILDAYQWSSYGDYCGKGLHPGLLQREVLLDYLDMPRDYRAWLKEVHDFSEINHLMID